MVNLLTIRLWSAACANHCYTRLTAPYNDAQRDHWEVRYEQHSALHYAARRAVTALRLAGDMS